MRESKRIVNMHRSARIISVLMGVMMLIALSGIIVACTNHEQDVTTGGSVTITGEVSATNPATHTPEATATPTNTSTPIPTDSPTPTPEPTATPTPEPTATSTPKPTATQGVKPTKKPTVTPDPNAPKRVAFTFDDGPHSTLTLKFAAKLDEYGGHGTWFVVGNRINEKTGEQLKTISDNGHEVAIHAYTHEYKFDRCSEDIYQSEMTKTAAAITKYIAEEITLMRPVGGLITKERISASPYAIIMWSVDSNDWRYKKRDTEEQRQANVDKIVQNVLKSVGDGDIILMHEIYQNSYEAFCILVEELDARGYEFVTVSELLNDPTPGYRYSQQ